MKAIVKMTKDKKNHKSFLVFVNMQTVKTHEKILEQMQKKTGVPWKINLDKTDSRFLAVETGDLFNWFKTEYPDDEKAYVNWRVKWKNQDVEIMTGK